jgi:hypothetical protein
MNMSFARRAIALLLAIVVLTALASCDFQAQADAKFGDQNFKTAIALVELHKVRNGVYPEQLKDLRFVGDWDGIALSAVRYQRVEGGYQLDVVRGWIGQPTLSYPPEFWKGLGLVRSNMKPT